MILNRAVQIWRAKGGCEQNQLNIDHMQSFKPDMFTCVYRLAQIIKINYSILGFINSPGHDAMHLVRLLKGFA